MSCRACAQPARAATASRSAEPGAFMQRSCACGTHVKGGGRCEGCRGAQRSRHANTTSALPAARRDKTLGEVHCTGGKLVRTVTGEHPFGNCVEQHEKAHQADPVLIAACRGVSLCLARDDHGVDKAELDPSVDQETIEGLCVSVYNRWDDPLDKPRHEYLAWSVEAQCLTDTIDASCGARAGRTGGIGAGIGAGLGAAGAGVGGAYAGQTIAKAVGATSPSGKTAGGALGAIGGVLAGGGLGAVAGYFIGKAAAGKQATEDQCDALKKVLPEVQDAVKEYKAGIDPALAAPFLPDGRIAKAHIKGLLKPSAPAAQAAPAAGAAR